LRSLFIEFVVLLCRSAGTEKTGRMSAEEKISRLLGMLENRFYEGWTVKRMAEKAGISEPSLYRLFKQLTGTSPTDYLLGLRLHHAKNLLENTAISVTEAAFETGFGNSSYFSRMFRKKYRCTPRQFRQRLLQ
jgi:AraC family L-rhamnose operon transcriptional activator RhaR/AraC family L-rhamnose operon regulatory protein RhaS